MQESRRDFLRATGALLGAGTVGGLAGCSSIPGLGGGSGGGVDYVPWLYAPGAVRDVDHYPFSAIQPASMAEYEDELDGDVYDAFEDRFDAGFDALDVDFDEVDGVVDLDGGRGSVLLGSFTTEDVVDELEDQDFDDEDEVGNYTVYLNEDIPMAVGVSGNALVVGRSGNTGGDDAGGSNPNLRTISYGQTVSGRIDSNDPSSSDYRGNYEPVTFQGSAGDVVTISMQSQGDTYLILMGPDGDGVAYNDDANGLNSRIEGVELPDDGEYTIIATSYDPDASFEYILSLSEGSQSGGSATQDLREIAYGETQAGRIDQGDPQSADYRGYYEPVTFEGSAGDVINVQMQSPDDTYLILENPDGDQIAENDDANGLNSAIREFQLEDDGEHTIIATSFSSYATFEYTLSLELVASPAQAMEIVETVANAKAGDADRYADEMDAVSELDSSLGGATALRARTHDAYDDTAEEAGRFEGAVGNGHAVQINGETATVTYAFVFEESDAVDTGDVEDWVDEVEDRLFDDVDDVSVSEQGKSAVVSGEIDTDDLTLNHF